MNTPFTTSLKTLCLSAALIGVSTSAWAGHHLSVKAMDQDVSGGTVTAQMIKADANGWMVVHRTDKMMKPGPVVGYAPLKKGANNDVTAILTEPVMSGDMLMLMLHGEDGGMKTGVFEYTLGSKADGPVREGGKLVMDVITVK
ncbi:hypothetical protein SAMN04488136_10426 [Vibrio xiamenensis]|uniref:DUF7282 domain-containing protein n=1 Tax=Vibrio xiamenensis TaxID=861298 RepID=A0A1G7XU50_9VIBR|nr:hypothetical protein [Vibrio xiamenensis]SDG76396.1 hypothetical protein SAMN04488136_102222 [Vibrio xiamenensis]SDG87671.1 hypothetical protein SAMN04488136_10426 [Vibrio xiamenensis]